MGGGNKAPSITTAVTIDELPAIDNEEQAAKEKNQNPTPALAAHIPEPTTATPQPEPQSSIEAEVTEHEAVITLGDRRYHIRGLQKNMSYDQLKVNVLVSRGDRFHVDTLDIYGARQRAMFIKQASQELGIQDEVIKKNLGKVLCKALCVRLVVECTVGKTKQP